MKPNVHRLQICSMLPLLLFPVVGWFTLTPKTCDTLLTGRDGSTTDLRRYLKKTNIECDDWTCLLFNNISMLFCFLGTRSAQQIIRKICKKLDWHDCGWDCWWQTGQETEDCRPSNRSEHGKLISAVFAVRTFNVPDNLCSRIQTLVSNQQPILTHGRVK